MEAWGPIHDKAVTQIIYIYIYTHAPCVVAVSVGAWNRAVAAL